VAWEPWGGVGPGQWAGILISGDCANFFVARYWLASADNPSPARMEATSIREQRRLPHSRATAGGTVETKAPARFSVFTYGRIPASAL
jgi:hypothetical protein